MSILNKEHYMDETLLGYWIKTLTTWSQV